MEVEEWASTWVVFSNTFMFSLVLLLHLTFVEFVDV